MPAPGPLRVQFRARESLAEDARRRLDRQAYTLARERLWWCGAPAVTIDSERQGRGYRLRLVGSMDLSFGWPDPAAARDDQFMAARDLRLLLDQLASWSHAFSMGWKLLLPTDHPSARLDPSYEGTALESTVGAERIEDGVIGPRARAILQQLTLAGGASGDEATDAPRAARLLALHADRHGPGDGPPTGTSRGLGELAHRIHTLRADLPLARTADDAPLVSALRQARPSGLLACGLWTTPLAAHPAGHERRLADRAVVELGLQPLGTGWTTVVRPAAHALAVRVLAFDQAYDTPQASPTDAAALADRFLGHDPAAVHLVNGARADPGPGSWSHLGGATFEAAIAVLSPGRLALLWIGDED